MASISRIMTDLKYIEEHQDEFPGILLEEVSNLTQFEVILVGPPGTPYEGGLFTLKVVVPTNYPSHPLEVRFKTQVFHPNVSQSGSICVDLLDDGWTPGMTLGLTLITIKGLLENPNPDSPLNCTASRMMKRDAQMYNDTVILWTNHFAAGSKSTNVFEDAIAMVMAGKGISRTRAIKELTERNWSVVRVMDM